METNRSTPSRQWMRRRLLNRRGILGLVGLLLLGLAAANIRWAPAEFAGAVRGSAGFYGADSYYHVRRMEEMLRRWPALPPTDYGVRYPDGVVDAWPPLFDLAGTALAWAAGCKTESADRLSLEGHNRCLEVVASHYAAIVGTIAVAVPSLVALWWFGWGYAVLTCLFVGFMAASVVTGLYARVDHHGLEQVLFTLTLATVAFCAVGKDGSTKLSSSPWVRRPFRVLMAGGCLGAFLLSWMGAILVIAPLVAYGAMQVVVGLYRSRVYRNAAAMEESVEQLLMTAGVLMVAAVVAYPFYGWFSKFPGPTIYGPTSVQVGLLVAASALLLTLAGVVYIGGTLSGKRRSLIVIGFSGLLLLGSLLAIYFTYTNAVENFFWGFIEPERRSGWYRYASEMQPLYRGDGQFDTTTGYRLLGTGFAVFPVALIAFWARGGRVLRSRNAVWLFLLFAVCPFFMSLAALRFVSLLAGPFSILLAWGTIELSHRLLRRPRSSLRLVPASALVAFLLLVPTLTETGELISKDGKAFFMTGNDREAVARFLRERTPDPGLMWGQKPEYGVLAPADMGHMVLYVGHRPTLYAPFGGRFHESVETYLSEDPEALLNYLTERRVRYVITDFVPERLRAYSRLLDRERRYFNVTPRLDPSGRQVYTTKPAFDKVLLYKLHARGPERLPSELRNRFRLVYRDVASAASRPDGISRYQVFEFDRNETTNLVTRD